MATIDKKFQDALRLYRQGSLNEATTILTNQLKKKPKNPDFLHLLATISSAQGQKQKADKLLNAALKFAPNSTAILSNLAANLLEQQQYSESKKLSLRCMKIDPQNWQTKFQLGITCRFLNESNQAEAYFEAALELNPVSTDSIINLIHIRLNTGKLSKMPAMAEAIEAMAQRCIKNAQTTELAMLIRMAPMIPIQAETYQQMLRSMDLIHTPPVAKTSRQTPRPTSKIRIAYIAGEFGDHPISHVMWDVFKHHDRDAFEIIVYSLINREGPIDQTYIGHIKTHCDNYVDLSALSVKQATERIALDEIDILVNLSGYMTLKCVQICSFRPAPINVYWLGQGGHMGLSTVDYVIANDIVIPDNEWPTADTKYHSESIASLPESYHCAPTPAIPECTWQRKDFGLDDNSFVFCAFNNPAKIDHLAFDSWMNILKRVPDSQLWLSNPYDTDDLAENLAIEAKRRGVDPARLVFATRIPEKLQHLTRHRLADLFLDTFTYSASTTAIDALWAGLPVLTRPGSDFFSRIGSSHVINAGLIDMVCESTQQYEDKAVALANNPSLLNEIREQLVSSRNIQPLFNVPRFVQHLESAYQQMFDRQQSGKSPASFRNSAA